MSFQESDFFYCISNKRNISLIKKKLYLSIDDLLWFWVTRLAGTDLPPKEEESQWKVKACVDIRWDKNRWVKGHSHFSNWRSFIAIVSLCPYTCTRQQLGGGVGAFNALFQTIRHWFAIKCLPARRLPRICHPTVRRWEKSITSLLGNGPAGYRQYCFSCLSPPE